MQTTLLQRGRSPIYANGGTMQIVFLGPSFGYYTNASKTWLITKPEHASVAFEGSNVQITSEERPYLGAPLGYMNKYIRFRNGQKN